jgi:hypothetical protein
LLARTNSGPALAAVAYTRSLTDVAPAGILGNSSRARASVAPDDDGAATFRSGEVPKLAVGFEAST